LSAVAVVAQVAQVLTVQVRKQVQVARVNWHQIWMQI
jgi:hypothetical protein